MVKMWRYEALGCRHHLGQLLLVIAVCFRSLADGLFVTDYFTRTPRKLNAFRSFASVELFHFHVPEDTVIAVWNLITFKEQGGTFGDRCPDRSVTVYFRSGAPPVINPLHRHFPKDTSIPGSFAVTLTWTLPNRTTGVFNVTSPLPGDWFLAAHLPKDQGKISVKGLHDECQYLFQPQLIVQRLIGIPVLYPGYTIEQIIPSHNRSALYKVFIPNYISKVRVQIQDCSTSNKTTDGCPVLVKVRAKAPPLHNSSYLDCRDRPVCDLVVDLPFWQQWYYILVERSGGNSKIYFQAKVLIKDCAKPGFSKSASVPPSSSLNMPQSFGSTGSLSLTENLPFLGGQTPLQQNGSEKSATSSQEEQPNPQSPLSAGDRCWPIRPTLRNELDTFSVHFYIFFGPNVSIPPDRPAVFVINLMPVLDSGGVLNLELKLNLSSLKGENVTVTGCLNHGMPLMLDNTSITCHSDFSAGFVLTVNTTSNTSKLRLPYPQTGTWYLSLRSLCTTEHGVDSCGNVTAEVYLRTYLTPCINDCGTYGQCKLLRTNNYLYAACECKAGWDGWGCTDNSEAYSYGFQLLSTLLLCLSNLMFMPPVAIAIRNHYLLEASVYIFTMFFSTFYHACDQPGIVVFCIMEYDVLQFCDFLGSLMSVWVTVIAMARLQSVMKQVLYLLGGMLLSMALQLDRHGLWNLLGPSLFALGIMAIAWTVRTIRRRHCYPPTWKRWVFYLCPGTLIAFSAVGLYAFVETEENYFYIHSIWHMLIAGSVGFLLPPRPKPDGKVTPLPRRKGCGYQLCVNEHEEMGLVDPGTVSINSICTS
ncbi:transmembrane protein 8B isoform X2 [Protopterus annectens]|uniref:transmembrane protein 8B isoform X2 n=1 Tax=Protopterus annectens TaxID=7888 RepID=UPI001CFA2562|nr:transmembrane protein 8B isoform X2 [Protopterus annectens]